ncbi:MAG: AI-2E family transporter [Stackebrandtia sp.]
MSRFGEAAARANRAWSRLRKKPLVQRIEKARHRNEIEAEAWRAAGSRAGGADEAPRAASETPDGPDKPPAPARQAGPDDDGVPRGLKIAAGWSWRGLVIAAAIGGVLWLASFMAIIVIPLLISLLLAAMLQPIAAFLTNKLRVPRTLSAAVVLIGGLSAVAGVLTWVINEIIDDADDLAENVVLAAKELQDWAKEGPLHLQQSQIDKYIEDAGNALTDWVKESQGDLASTGFDTLVVVFETFAGFFLVLFVTFFFLRDGRGIFGFLVRMLPRAAQAPTHKAGDASWRSLVSFIRGTILVAVVDAVGIGIGLALLEVPLALPLAALVFLGGFIPIVGATISGILAVLVALVAGPDTWLTALIVLGIVLLVQQIEGNILQPLIMGRAMQIDPLAIVLAVGFGVVAYGIIGALLSVPLVAVVAAFVKTIRAHAREGEMPDASGANATTG